jgi:hypothetical protein
VSKHRLHYIHQQHKGKKETMSKLINSYRAIPTMANRAKLQKYLATHMMAVCMASPDEVAFLKANEFKI